MHYSYLLFDLDGTIIDSSEGIINCVKYALDDAGLAYPPDEKLLGFIGPPLVEGFQSVTGMNEQDALAATIKYRERYETEGLYECQLYEGISSLIKDLHEKGYHICLATSKPELFARRILEHFELINYFDEIVGATFDGKINAKDTVIREMFKRLALTDDRKAETIMIGDRKHDILGAKACGIDSLGVYYGFAPAGEHEVCGADYIVDTVEDLRRFFL